MMDLALINWSRAQFALTACYHWLFVPLTLGLAVVMAVMETLYVETGRQVLDETLWHQLCHRCGHGYYSGV